MKRIVFSMMCCVVATAAVAFVFDNTGPSVDDINRWGELTRRQNNAAKSGSWDEALDFHREAMQTEMGKGVGPAGRASNCLMTFFYLWNLGRHDEARSNLDQCIEILRNSNYGNNPEARAVVFRDKITSGKVPESMRFSHTDIHMKNGIFNYIMEIPWAMEFKKWDDVKRRYDTLNRILDSQLHTARLESERIERTIKIQARQDFLEKHHETFDPDNRPGYDSPMREDWDACKRIYDIFD